jgi:hypothetical protein
MGSNNQGRCRGIMRAPKFMKGYYGTARILGDRTADSVAKLESNTGDEQIRASKAPTFDSLVDIGFLQYRTRLTDSDNSSAKAVTDGLIHANIIRDDSPKEVRETRHFPSIKVQNKEDEKTVIQIRRVSE